MTIGDIERIIQEYEAILSASDEHVARLNARLQRATTRVQPETVRMHRGVSDPMESGTR
jgi:hypothetical protein